MNVSVEILIQAAYALGVGALVGLERSFDSSKRGTDEAGPPHEGEDHGREDHGREDHSREDPDEDDEAREKAEAARAATAELVGVRTFSILALVGFAAALVGDSIPAIPPTVLAGVVILVVAMYVRAVKKGLGITTEIAAVGTCALGMLCHWQAGTAAVLAVAVTVLLASKRFAHSTVAKMRRIELTDTLKFLVVALVILPLLPDRTFDPYEAFNPYKVGLLVVLISGISYVGYFLTKFLGARRGLAITGVVGGLTSSTAVTAAMAQQAKEQPRWIPMCAAATLAANATMFARVLVVVAVLDVALVARLAWSVGGMAVVATIATIVLWFRAGKDEAAEASQSSHVNLKNPFSLGPAVKFAAFFVFILFALKLSRLYLGDQGLWAAAALSGLADVDAITLSLSEQARAGDVAERIAAIAITIAVVSNSVTKSGIAIVSGGWAFGRIVAAGLGLATAVGLALALLV